MSNTPFAFDGDFVVQFTVSILNLVLSLAIGSLVAGSARSAARGPGRPGPTPYPNAPYPDGRI